MLRQSALKVGEKDMPITIPSSASCVKAADAGMERTGCGKKRTTLRAFIQEMS